MERVLPSVLAFVLLAAPARAQWSVTGMLGDASTSPARVAIESRPPGVEIDVGPITFADESSRSPWYYGWRVGYGLHAVPWLAIEAEFVELGTQRLLGCAGLFLRLRKQSVEQRLHHPRQLSPSARRLAEAVQFRAAQRREASGGIGIGRLAGSVWRKRD